ncbi:hypothetical protein [Spiroplasma cantharicola]|uniref:Uncharacterized protein n=1 Tax=Spiroplasma cantharicola TaxID=362837 RepID=A0A0M4KCD3_9MOLU|nr:hypothetical protein [Spiroplasma cantharicola]ALD66340.1 hypothetical protein SCANT_v1c04340 [Spiroplasma cantharicola]
MNISYIDFDWNNVIAYDQNFIEIFRESSLILRDLKNYQLLFIGEDAIKHSKSEGNFIAINFTENSKILSEDNFILFINYFKDKYQLLNFPIIVNRYNNNYFFEKNNLKTIDILKFYSNISNEMGFIDLKYSELNIYNKKLNKLFKFNLGKQKILNLINRYFYLNHNSTLNTKKTKELLKQIWKGVKINNVSCRNFSTGQDNNIKINNVKEITKELEDNLNLIFKQIRNIKKYYMNSEIKEVFDYVD